MAPRVQTTADRFNAGFGSALRDSLTCGTSVSAHPQYAEGSGEPTVDRALHKWIAADQDLRLDLLGEPKLFDRVDRMAGITLSGGDGVGLVVTLGETTTGWVVDSIEACSNLVRP